MKTESTKKKKISVFSGYVIKNTDLHEALRRINNKKDRVISSSELRKSLGIK